MKYRHELKFEISSGDLLVIRNRMSAIMKRDIHAVDGVYTIRSLYFDNASNKALREKLNGVNIREKFRLRYYNNDASLIHLEKKSKINGLCSKESATVTKEQVEAILSGDCFWMAQSDEPLVRELYCKMTCEGLRPKTVVDYLREPFVFSPGNVRVTIDSNIRTGVRSADFLNPYCVSVPAGSAPVILEVKWDEFLPDIVRDALQLPNCRVGAFSKYAACRIYG